MKKQHIYRDPKEGQEEAPATENAEASESQESSGEVEGD